MNTRVWKPGPEGSHEQYLIEKINAEGVDRMPRPEVVTLAIIKRVGNHFEVHVRQTQTGFKQLPGASTEGEAKHIVGEYLEAYEKRTELL